MKTTEAKPPRPNVVAIFNGGDHAQVTACREQNPAPAEMPATENDTVRASHESLPRGGEKPPNVELTGLRRPYGEGPVERRVGPQTEKTDDKN
jgi:hypothetical protein